MTKDTMLYIKNDLKYLNEKGYKFGIEQEAGINYKIIEFKSGYFFTGYIGTIENCAIFLRGCVWAVDTEAMNK